VPPPLLVAVPLVVLRPVTETVTVLTALPTPHCVTVIVTVWAVLAGLVSVIGEIEQTIGQFTAVITVADVLLPGVVSPAALIVAWLLIPPQQPLPTVPDSVMVTDPICASVGIVTVATLPVTLIMQVPAAGGDTEHMILLKQSGRSSVTVTLVASAFPVLVAVSV
jgi:hypothetical protein